jgi:Spy/CpxP family protein refolding chaperone
MKSLRILIPTLGIVAALAGCSSGNEAGASSGTTTVAQAQSTDAGARPGHPHGGPRRGHHGGPETLVFAALHEEISLTPAQRSTIEGLVPHDRPAERGPDASRTAALAAAIRSGNVDAAALAAPRPDAAAMQARVASSAKALATLHDTLTKEQRSLLVDAVTSKGHGGPPHDGPPRGPGADPRGPGGPLGGLLDELGLSAAQRAQIEAKLAADRPSAPSDADREAMKARHEEMKKALDARLASFKADAFDANAFVAPPAGAPAAGPPEHDDRIAKELAAIVSVLDASQREKLAARIEQGPPRPHREGR